MSASSLPSLALDNFVLTRWQLVSLPTSKRCQAVPGTLVLRSDDVKTRQVSTVHNEPSNPEP